MLSFIKEKTTVWDTLRRSDKPVVLYGTGNGADKILDWCDSHGVKIAGIFASDEFVRGQKFRGFTVERYDTLKKRLNAELLVVIAFASERPEVLARFKDLCSKEEVVAPHLPLFPEKEAFGFAWLEKHADELKAAYGLLADDLSRKVFAAGLNYKLSGKIGYLSGCESVRLDDLRTLINPGAEEVYLDLGAYNGDTIKELGELTGWRWRKVIAAEPDRRNCRKLRLFAGKMAERGLDVEVHETGIWESGGFLGFTDSGGRQSTFIGAEKKSVPVTTVDELSKGVPVTYIKMDVEGAEMQALSGARRTIAAYAPKLFIAAYHYDEDLFRLPLFIRKLYGGYRIYLRKHPYVPAWELNYICIK